ncbi:hypothetical protein C8D87_11218 [Lentzea atacamensis]|uniref:Uncharacterized protein n=1 Tax=Lentzea atacamensis TaxID=531938 RepID=A0ABX9E075_9PSEU|nr:hypothetical protein C8D87_11218 [Lentzea atacamensis]
MQRPADVDEGSFPQPEVEESSPHQRLLVLRSALIVIGDDQNDPGRGRLNPVKPRLNPSPQHRSQLLRRSLFLSPRPEVHGRSGNRPLRVVPGPLDIPPVGPDIVRSLDRQPGDGRVVVNPNRHLRSPGLRNGRRRHRGRRRGRHSGGRRNRGGRPRGRRRRCGRRLRPGLSWRRGRTPLSGGRCVRPSTEEADDADDQSHRGYTQQSEAGGLCRTGRACGLGGGHQSSVLLARARTLARPVRTPRSRLTSIGSAASAASFSMRPFSSW